MSPCRRNHADVAVVAVAVATVVEVALFALVSGTESFCSRDKSEYFRSRIILVTAKYPELCSLPYCVCVISMDTDSVLHINLHFRSREQDLTYCQPEIQLGYDDAVTSVCPSITSNYSLHYRMTKGRHVTVAVLNDDERLFSAVVVISADGDHMIRVGCSDSPEGIPSSLSLKEGLSPASQGAQGGLIAGVVVLIIAAIVFIITLTTKM